MLNNRNGYPNCEICGKKVNFPDSKDYMIGYKITKGAKEDAMWAREELGVEREFITVE